MEEWKEYKLGELCNTISDTYKRGAKEVVLINTSDVLEGKCMNHERVLNEKLKGQFKKTFQYNDILYSEIRPANKRFAFVDFDATDYIASTKLMVLRHNDIIIPQYLFYILKSQNVIDELQMLAESRSGTFPQITFSELSNLSVLLPNKDLQYKIVSILSSLDDKIEVNRRINEQLEELAGALFKSWFVDFEPFKDGEFVESELGMIPKGWKVGTLGEYCKVKSGFAFKSSWWQDNGLKVIKIKNITSDGVLDMNDCSYVSSENTLKAKDFKTNVGDLLIAMTGATIGKFCMISSKEEMYVNQRVGKFFLGDNPILKLPFIYCTLKTERVYSEIVNKGQGSAQPNISGSDIENIRIPLPEKVDYLLLFNEKLNSVFDKIIKNQQEIRHLTTLRDTLLPKLMSGEIDVNEVKI